jgi:hypothetical protein
MSSRYFLDMDTDGSVARYEAIAASVGAGSAAKIIRTGVDGKIDLTFIPDTTSGSPELVTAEAAIPDYSFVALRYSSGRKVRGALAADTTRPAVGFVSVGVASGADATVYFGGILSMPATGLTTADTGALIFLSAATAGAATKTPPSGTVGFIVQIVGRIIEVSTLARIEIRIMPQYIRLAA